MICHPGDVMGKVMQFHRCSLTEAASSIWNTSGVLGFYRGAAIEFALVRSLRFGAF